MPHVYHTPGIPCGKHFTYQMSAGIPQIQLRGDQGCHNPSQAEHGHPPAGHVLADQHCTYLQASGLCYAALQYTDLTHDLTTSNAAKRLSN